MPGPDVGEYIVGAYLKLIKECDFIEYNVRPPGGRLKGLNELDVMGLDFKKRTAYLCEVTTHITGLLIRNKQDTVDTIQKKYLRMKEDAEEYLSFFPPKKRHFMYWSPVVGKGYITEGLEAIDGLELIINRDYTERFEELRELAGKATHNSGNPFFRMLQIEEHLRR